MRMSDATYAKRARNAERQSARSAVSKMSINQTRLFLTALTLAFLAAWIGSMRDYLPVADDFPFAEAFFEEGLWNRIWAAYAVTGIRRSFSYLVNMPLCAAPLQIVNYICLAFHMSATALVFDVSRRISGSSRLAFAVAVLFGIFPFGYGAVVWACGTYIIFCVLFFLGALSLLLRHARNSLGSDWIVAIVSGGLLFLGCLAGEHLVFASSLVGALALTATHKNFSLHDLKKPWVVAPVLSVGLFLALVLATQSRAGIIYPTGEERALGAINPRTLFSVWYYQVRNLDMFEPWLQPDAIRISLHDMGWLRFFSAIFLLVGALICFRKAELHDVPSTGRNEQIDELFQWRRWRSPIVIVFAMMFGVSTVHALAGGYAAASRHQYVPLMLLALLVAAVGAKYPNAERWLAWRCSLPLILLVILGVGTTWLVTGVNYFELKRHHALLNFLAMDKKHSTFRLEFEPPLYYLWPKMGRTITHDLDTAWVIDLGIRHQGCQPVTLSQNDSATTVRVLWNGKTNSVDLMSGTHAPTTQTTSESEAQLQR